MEIIMLPIKTEHPIYHITLPSGLKVSFRPFLEKERKILLMAHESNNAQDAFDAIVNILEGCLVSDTNIKLFSVVDVEYFFLQLRAKSMGEIVKLSYVCKNVVDSGIIARPCGHIMTTEVDITTAEVTSSNTDPMIKLNPVLVVKMKNPSFMVTKGLSPDDKDYIYKIVASSIDFVATEGNVLYSKDYSLEDMVEFVMNLTPAQFSKLEEYINDLPVLRKHLTCTCPKCNYEHDIVLEGYQSFFV